MFEDKNYYSEIESCKLFFELFKHLTTLGSSTVVILGTFVGNIFKSPDWTFLIIITFICFITSILSGVFGMFIMDSHIRGKEEKFSLLINLGTSALMIGGGFFVTGFIVFCTFVAKNIL